MAPDRSDPSDYFVAPLDSTWRWQEDGELVEWTSGATIAFRPELLAVLQRLRTQRLPPFGAIVLLLAACRDSWGEPPDKQELLEKLLARNDNVAAALLLARVEAGLNAVHRLPRALRSSVAARAELAATVFEAQSSSPEPRACEAILEALEHGLSEANTEPRVGLDARQGLLADLSWLARGLGRVDEAALELRMRTGLEQELVPAPVALPPSAATRSLLAGLRDDAELGGVARLAELLLAAVHLPRPANQPEDLPAGGVSDLSLRGSPDRLLLSELANDGLTLALRVAMNEALYLRRETPPRPPARRRLVLLDAGLRMWGVPRVFATAVGLALAAAAGARLAVEVFRAARDQLVPACLTTKAGLTEQLAALDHRAHPGGALAALRARADGDRDATDKADIVIVTGEDVLADRDFQRAVAAAGIALLYLATVRRDGRYQLHLQTPRGRKSFPPAQLALDDVLAPRLQPAPALLAPAAAARARPAIFYVTPFPLRLTVPLDPERCWCVADFGVLAYARDRRLLHWDPPRLGVPHRAARQLVEGLPYGNLHWAAPVPQDGRVLAVIGKRRGRGLHALTLDCESGHSTVTRLASSLEQPRSVFVHRQLVFLVGADAVSVVSPETGGELASAPLGGARHRHGRFFAKPSAGGLQWLGADFDGHSLRWVEVAGGNPPLLTVFDAVGVEGAVGLTCTGQLLFLGTPRIGKLHYPFAIADLRAGEISRDGHQVVVSCAGPGARLLGVRQYAIIEVIERTVRPADSSARSCPVRLGLAELHWRARHHELRHKFTHAGIDQRGRLALVDRRGQRWALTLDRARDRLELPTQPSEVPLASPRLLQREPPFGNHYELAAAVFADGSRVVLDSRGLLHLRSSDASLAECTIVLAPGETAGWTSQGACWGSSIFIGDHPPSSAGAVYDEVLGPILARMARAEPVSGGVAP